MKKAFLVIIAILSIAFILNGTQEVRGGDYTDRQVYSRHFYGHMLFPPAEIKPDGGRLYLDFPDLSVWTPDQEITVIGVDGHLKANDHIKGNEVSHASIHMNIDGFEPSYVLFYTAAFDRQDGQGEQSHFNIMFPMGTGVYVSPGQYIHLNGRGVGKTTGWESYSACVTLYYVRRR